MFRHRVDHVALEPAEAVVHREVVHLGGAAPAVDRAAHHRHRQRQALVAERGHQRDRGHHRHGGLAHRHHVHLGAEVADELRAVGDVVVEMERAVLDRHHPGVDPVGDVDVVLGQKRAHGVAQQRRVVPGERREHQHGGVVRAVLERLGQQALELEQPAERLRDLDALGHRDLVTRDLGAPEAEFGLLVILAQPVQQFETGSQPGGVGHHREHAVRVGVQLAHRLGPVRERREHRAVDFTQLVEHRFGFPFAGWLPICQSKRCCCIAQ